MVRYPDGRCSRCGEREYATADGALWCPNCAQRPDDPSSDGGRVATDCDPDRDTDDRADARPVGPRE